jgi:predicted nucleic-acid-binding protein
VFEVVYVLVKKYNLTREEIVGILIKLLQEERIRCSRQVLINSLLRYQDNRQLSLVDCYLLVLAEDIGAKLVTRDKQLLKRIR